MKFIVCFAHSASQKTTIFHPYKYVGEAKSPVHGQS